MIGVKGPFECMNWEFWHWVKTNLLGGENHEYVALVPGFVLVHAGLDIELEPVLGERLRTMLVWLLCQQVQ